MDGLLAINPFDAAVYVCVALGVAMGFGAGLLRSLATIFAYLVAAPLALAATPYITPILIGQLHVPPSQIWIALAAIVLLLGVVLSALFRYSVGEIAGESVSALDRLTGAVLGGGRMLLLAVLMTIIFDRIIPSDREPAFLQGSRLRPLLSQAGQAGLKSLPPEVNDYIDRMKRERGL